MPLTPYEHLVPFPYRSPSPSPCRARQSKYVSRVIIFFIWTVSLLVAMPMVLILHVVENEYVTIRK